MVVHELDRQEARRIAIRAQLLDQPRPVDLMHVVRQLSFLQIDPTAAIAPSADLIAWSRLGSSYRPSQLQRALEVDRTMFEYRAMIRPMSDLPLYRSGMALWPSNEKVQAWMVANDRFRSDILSLLGTSGPLLSRDIPDTSVVAWPSSGWTNNQNVTQMLEFLTMRGDVAISGRVGRQRIWDLAARVYPKDAPIVPPAEALACREERRLASLGITRENAPGSPSEPGSVGEAGDQAIVEGLPGMWRVDPAAIGRSFSGRTALLSPFDRLVHDRSRLAALFDFEYTLEMYKPKAKRRWGYFALPILHDDRMIGKVDAAADRKGGVLRVDAIHQDVAFDRSMTDAVHEELSDLALWLQLVLA